MPSKKKSAPRGGSTPSRAPKRPVRKPVTRRSRVAKATTKDSDDLLLVPADELAAAAEPASRASNEQDRPEVAVVGQTASEEPLAEIPPTELKDVVLRFPEDIPVAVVSLILAGAAFLPWYKLKLFGGKTLTTSGWATGTWGPMVAILGALSAVIAILRIAGVRVKLPYPDATVHEAVGWLALIGTVIKFRIRPKGPLGAALDWHMLIFVSAGAALILAMLAGRMSKVSPFASVPNWFAGKAGRIGAALLVLAVGGSVAFGMTNKVNVNQMAYGTTQAPTNTLKYRPISGRFPECAKSFPRPDDAKPSTGFETPCSVTFTTKQSPTQMLAFYKSAFDKQGQKYKTGSPPGGYQAMCLSDPLKAIIYIASKNNLTTVVFYTLPTAVCPFGGQPTPSRT